MANTSRLLLITNTSARVQLSPHINPTTTFCILEHILSVYIAIYASVPSMCLLASMMTSNSKHRRFTPHRALCRTCPHLDSLVCLSGDHGYAFERFSIRFVTLSTSQPCHVSMSLVARPGSYPSTPTPHNHMAEIVAATAAVVQFVDVALHLVSCLDRFCSDIRNVPPRFP
jgi:hypothetical protein